MESPLVSVIIPTSGRPKWLPRAVESCLAGMAEGQVEVLVIPNGPDTSWRQSLAPWLDSPVVRVSPLVEANQNSARNHGLDESRGELVRFLDDDDFLLPDGATAQYRLMQDSHLDVCSGPAAIRDQDGTALGVLTLPETPDFIASALRPSRLQLPFAHVYRRNTLGDVRWPIEIRRSEDIVFLIRYAVAARRKWGTVSCPVGVWFQHDAPRMSFDRPDSSVHETTAGELLAAHVALAGSGRLGADTARDIAEALWHLIHRSFFLRPVYWTRIAAKAKQIDAGARPGTAFFRNGVVRSISPILLHWAVLPLLLAKSFYRNLRARTIGRDYRRTL